MTFYQILKFPFIFVQKKSFEKRPRNSILAIFPWPLSFLVGRPHIFLINNKQFIVQFLSNFTQ